MREVRGSALPIRGLHAPTGGQEPCRPRQRDDPTNHQPSGSKAAATPRRHLPLSEPEGTYHLPPFLRRPTAGLVPREPLPLLTPTALGPLHQRTSSGHLHRPPFHARHRFHHRAIARVLSTVTVRPSTAPPRRPRLCPTSLIAGLCDRGGCSHGAPELLAPHRRAQPAPESVTVLPHSCLVPPALARPSGLMPLAPLPRPDPARGRPGHPLWFPTAFGLASSSHQTPWPQTYGSNNGSTTRTSRWTIFGESWRDPPDNRWNGSSTPLAPWAPSHSPSSGYASLTTRERYTPYPTLTGAWAKKHRATTP